jgi:methyltransferase
MNLALLVLALVTLQRASELVMARRNTRALMAKGGVEHGSSHYPVMVALHASWLAGLWWFGWNAEVNLVLLAVYGLLQLFRLWILLSIGKRWTTRIITVSGETLVARGPYRFIRHPNYLLVFFEVPLLPFAFGLNSFAILFFTLNCLMLAWRIRAEEKALRPEVRN